MCRRARARVNVRERDIKIASDRINTCNLYSYRLSVEIVSASKITAKGKIKYKLVGSVTLEIVSHFASNF